MRNFEIINTFNLLQEFINKDMVLPYALRRGIRKNADILVAEYKIFDEERNKIFEDTKLSDEEKEIKVKEMLETDVELEFVKVPANVLENIDMTLRDEVILDFMIIEE
jgi:hypothetical protein